MSKRALWGIAGALALATLIVGITTLRAQRPMPWQGLAPPGRFVVAYGSEARVVILDSSTGHVYAAEKKDFKKITELPTVGEAPRAERVPIERDKDFQPRDKDKHGRGRPERVTKEKDKHWRSKDKEFRYRDEDVKDKGISHHVSREKEDTWDAISKRYYGSDRYAEALKAYNGQADRPGQKPQADTVFVPDQSVLLRRHATLVPKERD